MSGMTAPLPLLVGRVRTVCRYPVKSSVGETLVRAQVDERGLVGDRLWCVRDDDGKFGSGKSTRRFRKMDGLLHLVATYDGDVPVIAFPDGRVLRGDDPDVHAALSEHVGRTVVLAREGDVSHFDDGPVHLVTRSTMSSLERAHGAPVDVRRLRPNLVVQTDEDSGFVEDDWIGQKLAIGAEVVLEVRAPMPRCVMLDLPQHELLADGGLLKTATEINGADIGIVADVVAAGTVAVGDEVRLLR
jgi:uncharacterized protein